MSKCIILNAIFVAQAVSSTNNNFIVTSSLIDWPQYYAGRLSHLTLRGSDPCAGTKFVGVTPVGRN